MEVPGAAPAGNEGSSEFDRNSTFVKRDRDFNPAMNDNRSTLRSRTANEDDELDIRIDE